MSVGVLDRGALENETPEMRRKREEVLKNSPPPQFFKLRAEMISQGRTNQIVAQTDNMLVNLKVYAGGGENGLHNHNDDDHFHLILQGSACFYGPRGEETHCGQYEGIMIPAGCFYRFQATSEEPLILLRVGCNAPPRGDIARTNVYGEPLPSESKENGRVEVIPRKGEFWGAAE